MSLTTMAKVHSWSSTRVASLMVSKPDIDGEMDLGTVYSRKTLPLDPSNIETAEELVCVACWSSVVSSTQFNMFIYENRAPDLTFLNT